MDEAVAPDDDRDMCLFLILIFLGPRAGLVVYWLGWPARWSATFDSFLVPFIGFLFLPWATLMYLWVAPNGVNGFDYVWLGLAALVDVASYASSAGGARWRRASGPVTA